MALEKLGIGGVLKFSTGAAIGGMKKAGAAFGVLKKRGAAVSSGFSRMASGSAGLAASLAGGGLAVGFMANTAAKFEQQMSAVNAILDETNRQQMPELTQLAKEMGLSTVFSATQAGQGIEAMARSGASANDIIAGLGGVLNAAAADGMSLGDAASIVSNIVNSMNLSFDDAIRVSDVLAKTSSKTNTNIRLLGTAFTYASPAAQNLGFSLETTSTALGAIADAGLRGAKGGTSFANMLEKLGKPSKKAAKLMKDWKIELVDSENKIKPLNVIIQDFAAKIDNIRNPIKRSAAVTELFGMRGKKAFNALSLSSKKLGDKNLANLEAAITNSAGAAKEMANLRLDNLLGSFTLLRSAAEGFFIEVFSPLLPLAKQGVDAITLAVQNIGLAMQVLSKPTKDAEGKLEKLGTTAKQVALGIGEGIVWIKNAWATTVSKFKEAEAYLKSKLGPSGVKSFAKWATIIGIVGAAVTPILVGFGLLIALVGTSLIPLIGGLAAVIGAVWEPVLLIGTVGYLLWKNFGKEIYTFAIGLRAGLIPALGMLKEIWIELLDEVKTNWDILVYAWTGGSERVSSDMQEVGRVVGAILLTVIRTGFDLVIMILSGLTKIIAITIAVGRAIWTGLSAPFKYALDYLLNFEDAWNDIMGGSVLSGIAKIGLAIVDQILIPFRAVVRMAVRLGKGIGFEVSPTLSRFAEQGFSGLAFGPDNVGAVPEDKPRPAATPAASPAARREAAAAKRAKETDDTVKSLTDAIKTIPDKQKIDITNIMKLDGRETALASEKHKVELQERSGFKSSPWQRRMAIEHGGVPLKAGT